MRTTILTVALMFTACAALAQSPIAAIHPRPKVAFEQAGAFTISAVTPIAIDGAADSVTVRAAEYLRGEITRRTGVTLPIVRVPALTDPPTPGILMGMRDAFGRLGTAIDNASPPGEGQPGSGGYVIDAAPGMILVCGADADGVFNGAATLAGLVEPGPPVARVGGVHIWDYPDYPIRWVFSQHNLRGSGAISALRRIQDTMARYHLNGIQQNDFKYSILESQPRNYFDSVRLFRTNAAATNTEIIPGVAPIGWSSGLLWHDPNLAEGFPAQAVYVMQADTGRLIPDARVALPNGSFESVGGNGKFTGWSFYDDGSVTEDRSVFHGGAASARCSNFAAGNPSGNCRFNRRVDCAPYRTYVMSAWVRTDGFSGDEVRLMALGLAPDNSTRGLTFTAFSIPATSGTWVRVEATFSTLEFSTVLLYAGVWGGRAGTIWWDDIEVREAGLANVLRRAGTPLHVRSISGAREYAEGVDLAPIVDSVMLRGNGDYGPYHTPPVPRRIASGALRNGDTIVVSYFHPLTTVSGIDGNGSVMVCVSEPKLYQLLGDQFRRVDSLYSPQRFFLGHDEIRTMNRDSACLARAASPAVLLADNLRQCVELVESVHPGAETFVWSDMFDSLHNAYKNYYLINGDLSGIWGLIPRTPTIVNWNYGDRAASLGAFARLGFAQIASPYYDEGGTSNMRGWRRAMEGVPGMRGMMYTTWGNDFNFLRPFAYYAWGAGPYAMHRPVDTAALSVSGDTTVCFSAVILPDPYDPADGITRAWIAWHPVGDTAIRTAEMQRRNGDTFAVCIAGIPPAGFRYTLHATNAQGLARALPEYRVEREHAGAVGGVATPTLASLRLVPNPATVALTAWVKAEGACRLELVDMMGSVVRRVDLLGDGAEHAIAIDLAGLPSGGYHCQLRTARGLQAHHRVDVVQ